MGCLFWNENILLQSLGHSLIKGSGGTVHLSGLDQHVVQVQVPAHLTGERSHYRSHLTGLPLGLLEKGSPGYRGVPAIPGQSSHFLKQVTKGKLSKGTMGTTTVTENRGTTAKAACCNSYSGVNHWGGALMHWEGEECCWADGFELGREGKPTYTN